MERQKRCGPVVSTLRQPPGTTDLRPASPTLCVDRDTLTLGIAAVFAGTFVTMSVLALSHSLFLLLVALPFGAASYFLWWQVSEDLEARFRRRAEADATARREATARSRAAEAAAGGDSRFAEEARRRVAEERRRAEAGRRAAGRGGADGAGRRSGGPSDTGMARREAFDALGLDGDASQEQIKTAYRDRVKEVHPDSGGDEESFKRVNRAYETLTEE